MGAVATFKREIETTAHPRQGRIGIFLGNGVTLHSGKITPAPKLLCESLLLKVVFEAKLKELRPMDWNGGP